MLLNHITSYLPTHKLYSYKIHIVLNISVSVNGNFQMRVELYVEMTLECLYCFPL